jgi:uncharacterized membrane protein YbhN (UPF0104 family)
MSHRFQKILACTISITIAALILGGMILRVWDDLLIAIGDIQYRYLIPILGLSLASWVMRGYRYQKILNNLLIPAGFFFSIACIFLGKTVNMVVPARVGDVVRIIPIHQKYKATISQGLSSVILERALDITTIALLGLIAVVFMIDAPVWLVSTIAMPLCIIGTGILLILVSKEWKAKNRYLGFVLNLFDEIRMVSLSLHTMATLFAISTIIWICDITICYFVALMFHATIPFDLLFLAIAIANIVKAVPVTPGGIGTYELALATTLEFGAVPAAIATMVSIMDHLMKNLITLIGGVASIMYFGTWIIPHITDMVKTKLLQNGEK